MIARTGSEAVIGIVREVAKRKGVKPMDLPPLYDSVDPDALQTVVTSVVPGAGGSIEFDYCGYEISVFVDGEIVINARIPEPI